MFVPEGHSEGWGYTQNTREIGQACYALAYARVCCNATALGIRTMPWYGAYIDDAWGSDKQQHYHWATLSAKCRLKAVILI